jgi:hypothetical protein
MSFSGFRANEWSSKVEGAGHVPLGRRIYNSERKRGVDRLALRIGEEA